MLINLFKSSWAVLDAGELRFILHEIIGGPGQYHDRSNNPNTFFLPLAGSSCRIKLTFSDGKQIVAIEPGPAFDATEWARVVEEIETSGPIKVGRDCSFSSFRVIGSWRGSRSGVQILPPPTDAPCAPFERAEHPLILEYPVKASSVWPITNYRRMNEHRRLTLLLNVLLTGRTSVQPRRFRHLWAAVPGDDGHGYEIKWVQEFFYANFGESVIDELSPATVERIEEVDPETYYIAVHDGRTLQGPADLDDLICCYTQLSPGNRAKFGRASFWMDMAARQWTISLSASFASLVIAIEALAERGTLGAGARFRNFIEKYAYGASLENRRKEMYSLRSEILHGSGLMEMDQDDHFGWDPPKQNERDIIDELWALTRIAVRKWLKNPPTI
jgi:hypothetical protein